jgi:hypothetical protein
MEGVLQRRYRARRKNVVGQMSISVVVEASLLEDFITTADILALPKSLMARLLIEDEQIKESGIGRKKGNGEWRGE